MLFEVFLVLFYVFAFVFLQEINQEQILSEVDGSIRYQFGVSVSIAGNIAVFGVGNSPQGTAHVFVQNGTKWIQQQKLVANDGNSNDDFGTSVSISGTTIVIGAPGAVIMFGQVGAVYVFIQNGTNLWIRQQKLIAKDSKDGTNFGKSVSISGGVIVVYTENVQRSITYIFIQNGGTWVQQQKLLSQCITLGVSVLENLIVIGYPYTANSGQGEAYIFIQNGTDYWIQQQKLIASDGNAKDAFGTSVSISGTTIVISATTSRVSGYPRGAVYVFIQNGTNYWIEQQKLFVTDGNSGDRFGWTVSISGNTIVVGAPYHSINGNSWQGAVYVFIQNETNYWIEQQKFVASDGKANDQFGYSVSISGNTIVIGSPYHANDQYQNGAGYIFTNENGNWNQNFIAHVYDPYGGDSYFGYSTAISSANIVVIGSPQATISGNSNQGAVYVFIQSGMNWILQQELVAGDAMSKDNFGTSVSISGNTIVIGAPYVNSQQGSAYVFIQNGTNYWIQQQKLVANDGSTNAQFGYSVSISGDIIVIGAYQASVNETPQRGAVYVFIQNGMNEWIQQQKLVANDGSTNDQFGYSVSISGNTIVIGAPYATINGNSQQGASYVFIQNGMNEWIQKQRLNASDGKPYDYFGTSVGISGNAIVIGARTYQNKKTFEIGVAYVFDSNGTNYWIQQQELIPSDGKIGDGFGYSVTISGNIIVIGSPYKVINMNIVEQGAVYVFVQNDELNYWVEQQKLLASDGNFYNQFGHSVSISESVIVIGAHLASTNTQYLVGKTYLFSYRMPITTQYQQTTQQQTTQRQTTQQQTTQETTQQQTTQRQTTQQETTQQQTTQETTQQQTTSEQFTDPNTQGKSNQLGAILGGTLGGILGLGCIAIILITIIHKKKQNEKTTSDELATLLDSTHEEKEDSTSTKVVQKSDSIKIDSEQVKLYEKLGEGNFGEIYKAQYGSDIIAAKCFKDKNQKDKFFQEAAVLKLRHPNIIECYGWTEIDGKLYLLFEYAKHGSLDNYLNEKKPFYIFQSDSVRELLDISCKVSQALLCLHDNNIIHRDLAADNILVSEGPKIKLADFGLAKFVRTEHNMHVSDAHRINWSAPEVIKRGKASKKSDIYSFGVVLWQIFSYGKKPEEEAKNLPRPPACPDRVWELMQNCWKYSTKDRPTAKEVNQTIKNELNYVHPKKTMNEIK